MKQIVQKFIVIILFSAFLFPAGLAMAQSTESPIAESNPLCWKKDACVAKRQEMLAGSDISAAEGWIQEAPCTGDYGKCLATAITKAEVTFGSSGTFTNAGDYIKTVYNYGITIIGILAVVMIIISGAQWITSAGNVEVIGHAKKRISGAIIGLFLAYMSYAILNTINPSTVNLRLPQVWMIANMAERGAEVAVGEYCDPYGTNESKTACESSGENFCFTIGYDSNMEGPCMKFAQYVVEGSMLLMGGAVTGIAGKAGSVMGRLATNAGSKITKFAVNIPAKELANYTKSEIAKSALKSAGSKLISSGGVKWGSRFVIGGVACSELSEASADTVTCGKLAIAAAGEVKEFAIEEFEDFFANHNGVCMKKAEGLQNGEMCDVQKTQCAPPGKCVPTPGTTAIMKCWTNKEIGFCSDGANKAICATNSDCKSNRCITDQYVPQCSDGGNDSPCMKDEDCASGLTCSTKSAAFTDLLGRCVGTIGGYGALCRSNFECGETSVACYALKVSTGDCVYNSLEADESGGSITWGMMDMQSGVIKKGYGVCAQNPSNSEIGPYLGNYVFYNKNNACGWTGSNMKKYTLCADDSVCGGGTCKMTASGMGVCQ